MENYQKLKAAQDYLREIKGSTTAIAHDFKTAAAEKQSELSRDKGLTSIGRREKLAEFADKKGAEFVVKAAELRESYDKAAEEVYQTAQQMLDVDISKPTDAEVKTFERKLSEFQMELMLSINAESALTLAQSFAEQTAKEPYFAEQLKTNLPFIVKEVTALAGVQSPQYKLKLRALVDELNTSTTTPEQAAAKAIVDRGSEVGADIWNENGLQYAAIRQALGSDFARYANKPSAFNKGGE